MKLWIFLLIASAIRIGGTEIETTYIKDYMKELNSKLDTLQNELNLINYCDFSKSLQILERHHREKMASLKKLEDQETELTESFKKLEDRQKEKTESLKILQGQGEETTESLKKLEAHQMETTALLQTLERDQKESLQTLERYQNETVASLQKLERDRNETALSLQILEHQGEKTTESLKKLEDLQNKTAVSLQVLDNKGTETTESLKKLGDLQNETVASLQILELDQKETTAYLEILENQGKERTESLKKLEDLQNKTAVSLQTLEHHQNETAATLKILGDLENKATILPNKTEVHQMGTTISHHLNEPTELPSSCVEVFQRDHQGSGVYTINLPKSGLDPFDVYCLEDPKGGVPWTVLQRRVDDTTDFYRDWADYKHGFGNLSNNFILGLDKWHVLTTEAGAQELWVKLSDIIIVNAYYDRFAIGDERDKYAINVLGKYSGDAGNFLFWLRNTKFTTRDSNNNVATKLNCAKLHTGAWWYRACHHSNLNGVYGSNVRGKGIHWLGFRRINVPIKYAHMAIRPAQN